MKETTNFKLKMPELSDTVSAAPLNENAQIIDAALHTVTSGMAGRLMIAAGSYTGDGTMSVSIETPGMKAVAMLVRKKRTLGNRALLAGSTPVTYSIKKYTDMMETEGGWLLWMGTDIPISYCHIKQYDDLGLIADAETKTTHVAFTAQMGSLSWSAPIESPEDMSELVNNTAGIVYEWVALGNTEA